MLPESTALGNAAHHPLCVMKRPKEEHRPPCAQLPMAELNGQGSEGEQLEYW